MAKPQPVFFNAKALGRSLKEVASELIKTETQEVTSRWFHSPAEMDLFIWSDTHQNIIKQQMSFHGQIVEWNLIEGVRTGLVYEDENLEVSGQPQSELIRYDESLQRTTLEQAIEILSFVDGLSEQDKTGVIENFLKDPSLSKLSPEVFLQKYKRLSIAAPQTPSFFERILSTIGRWFK